MRHRYICITLICCFIFASVVPCFASTDVNITNSGSSYAVDDRGNISGGTTVSFSNWMSNIGYNVAKAAARTIQIAATLDSYLGDMWTTFNNATYGILAQGVYLLDLKNNLYSVGGQVADVSSKLVTTNGYLATSDASLTNIKTNITNLYNSNRVFKGSAANISFQGLSIDNNTYSLTNASGNIVYSKVTFSLPAYFTQGDTILIVTLPITPNLVDYVEVVDFIDNNFKPDLFLCDYNTYSTTFYLRLFNGVTPSSFTFAFHMKDGTSVQQRIKYAGTTVSPSINYFYDDPNHNSIQYYNLLSDLYTLKNSQLIQEQTDAIKSLANEFNGTNGIIQDDSDTTIIVDFDADTGEDVSDFITTVKNFFDTGVSIGELTIALNQFSQMPWFTSLETYNTVNDQGAYFKDLY